MTATTSLPLTGPVSRIDPATAYRRPAIGPGMLRLDSNEGVLPSRALLGDLANADPEVLRRYPDVSALEAALAARVGVAPDRVLVTAGADEAIDRACRAFLEPGRALVLPDPSFDMFDCSAALALLSLALGVEGSQPVHSHEDGGLGLYNAECPLAVLAAVHTAGALPTAPASAGIVLIGLGTIFAASRDIANPLPSSASPRAPPLA